MLEADLSTWTMREAEVQWLDIDYSQFTRGQYIIEAPQSCNKTGGIGTLKDNVLLLGSRNCLLKQTQSRFPDVIKDLHITGEIDEQGKPIYTDIEIIRNSTGLGMNYSSLYKLRDPLADLRRFRFLLIDEPNLLWSHTTLYKPDYRNEEVFERLVINTPVVIWLGANIDREIREEIEEFAMLRKNNREQDKPIHILDKNNLSENHYVREAYKENNNEISTEEIFTIN